jgi:alanyl-tRNA synthetase
MLSDISRLLQTTPEDAAESVRQLVEKNKELRKGQSTGNAQAGGNAVKIDFDSLLEKMEKIGKYQVLSHEFPAGTEISILRDFADRYRQKEKTGICLFGARQDEKAILIFAAAKELTPKPIDCNILMKAASPFIEGGGGGRPDMVQAGGKNIQGLQEALQAGLRKIQEL